MVSVCPATLAIPQYNCAPEKEHGDRRLVLRTDLLQDLVTSARPDARTTSARASMRESPFIVGLLGHRDLEPGRVPRLCAAVAAFLAEIREHLPDTELCAIVGVTRGCDVRHVLGALEFASHVEVVLPALPEEHGGDFDADALRTLSALLTHPNVSSTVLSAEAGPFEVGDENARESRYANLTETLVRRSSVLLTFWDGHSPLRGGIPSAALRHVGVGPAAGDDDTTLVMLDITDDLGADGSVIHWTPGTLDADTSRRDSSRMPPQLVRQLADLNAYNRDHRELRSEAGSRTPSSLLALVPDDLALDDRPALEAIDAEYGKADALALHYQSRSDRLFALFATMAFTMGFAYLTYDKLAHRRSLLVSYLVVLVCSLCIYYALRGRRWFAKHLSYRALAETLRIVFYLRLIHIDHRLDAARVLALSGIHRFRGFSLIADVLAALAIPDARAADRSAPDSNRSRYVEHEWLEGQHRYFAAKVAQFKREERRVRTLKNALFATVVLVIIAMALSDHTMERHEILSGVSVKTAVTFAWGLLALLLGAWQLHDNNKATRELLLQYRNQGVRFAHAGRQLLRLADINGRNDILVELGRDSLMECYLWTIHRYHREHEPVGKR
jgi:hypothetical protein